MDFSIRRWSDAEYLVETKDHKQDTLFVIENPGSENPYFLVKALAAEILFKGTKSTIYNKQKWKVEELSKGVVEKLLSALSGIWHDIETRAVVIRGEGRIAASGKEVAAGRLMSDSDPFTELATHAFTHGYERNYSAKDNVTPHMSDSALILDGDTLKLVVNRKSKLFTDEANKTTVSAYYEHISLEYGVEKVKQLERAYGLDFTGMIERAEALTPEHIYRMNIGLNLVDVDDCNSLLEKLPALTRYLENLSGDEEPTSKEIAMTSGVPHRVIRSFMQELTAESDSDTESSEEGMQTKLVDHLLDWIYMLKEIPKTISAATEHQLQDLMRPFSLDEKAFDRSLTGRKIYHSLQSGYTTAELKKEKLWIDHQELSQAFEAMRRTHDLDLWLEKLDHVVVKANMLKQDARGHFQIRTLIPAPLSHDGHPRWYKVTRCLSNGYGVFTYRLEPATKDSNLPTVFLARSTASSEYALNSVESILNDLNALNPPGYEGQSLNVKYDAEVFKDYTIPIWVGHLEVARRHLAANDIKAAHSALVAANRAYKKEFEAKIQDKKLRDLVREYDWLLNRVAIEIPYGNLILDYLGIYSRLMRVYAVDPKKYQVVSQNEELQDAKKLKIALEKLQGELRDPYVTQGVDHFIGRLTHHIIDRSHASLQRELREGFAKEFAEAQKLEDEVYQAYSQRFSDQIPDQISKWYTALYELAGHLRERFEDKKTNGLIVTGQSLGGAISQVTMCKQLNEKWRIPVSLVHAYTISAPGIRHEDCEAFLQYADATKELRSELGSEITLTHLTEAADVIFLIGEGHLGAAGTDDEAEVVKESINHFRCEVRRMNPGAFGAFGYTTVHATQFTEGKEGVHYTKTPIDARTLAKLDDAEYVVAKNRTEEQKLLKDAKQHKNAHKYPALLSGELLNKVPKNSALLRRYLNDLRQERVTSEQLDAYGVFVVDGKD